MKISIVTTSYNSEKTIEKTILSVIREKYQELDYIFIDAGSTDHTMDIVNRYREFFSVIISEKDKGVSDGFNKGVRHASGDLILILNSDDELYPGALKKVEEAYDGMTDVYYGDYIVIDDKNGTQNYQKAFQPDMLKYRLVTCHQSIFATKKAYQKYGGYSLKYKLCPDYDLFARMYFQGASFKYISYPVCRYHLGGCTYVNPAATCREDMYIAKKHGLGILQRLKYTAKYLAVAYGKFACEKLGIISQARRIRQLYNHNVHYTGIEER